MRFHKIKKTGALVPKARVIIPLKASLCVGIKSIKSCLFFPSRSARTLQESERRSPPFLMTASNSKTSGWRWSQFRGLALSLLTALITWVPSACLTRHGSYSACLRQHVLRALPECTAKAAKPEVNSHWSCHGVEVMWLPTYYPVFWQTGQGDLGDNINRRCWK